MKVKYIAMYLSLVAVTIPAQAVSSEKNPHIKQSTVVSTKIDLNKADLSILMGSIKGIGKKRAEAIISYRETHHGFKAIEELAEVKGFGQRFIEANRDKLKEVFVIN
ncbi:competence protein ComEA [Legionella antarctica]|uniref:Competence protein ComEA n=1 Tax=Legionella antarctica TaxID=2708020 RepID=A0A6F8T3I9_9GAMM|nr:helix-hairpin-helix domain-containing protein [Legionella antarctica]BCA95009.1 competence protein ComEA [Legionella antarctica]